MHYNTDEICWKIKTIQTVALYINYKDNYLLKLPFKFLRKDTSAYLMPKKSIWYDIVNGNTSTKQSD